MSEKIRKRLYNEVVDGIMREFEKLNYAEKVLLIDGLILVQDRILMDKFNRRSSLTLKGVDLSGGDGSG